MTQNYYVQTLPGRTDTGSDGFYWTQPIPIGNGSGNELDVSQMYFDPSTLQIRSVWMGNWFYGPSVVAGKSWLVVLPNDMPTSYPGKPKKWTVYTP